MPFVDRGKARRYEQHERLLVSAALLADHGKASPDEDRAILDYLGRRSGR